MTTARGINIPNVAAKSRDRDSEIQGLYARSALLPVDERPADSFGREGDFAVITLTGEIFFRNAIGWVLFSGNSQVDIGELRGSVFVNKDLFFAVRGEYFGIVQDIVEEDQLSGDVFILDNGVLITKNGDYFGVNE